LKAFQLALQDYFDTRKSAVTAAIREKGAIDDAITAELKAALTEFKQGYKA
jgi:F-type H+-transporting ATPase subunit alpha